MLGKKKAYKFNVKPFANFSIFIVFRHSFYCLIYVKGFFFLCVSQHSKSNIQLKNVENIDICWVFVNQLYYIPHLLSSCLIFLCGICIEGRFKYSFDL